MNHQTNQPFSLLYLLSITLILTHITGTQFPFAKAGKVHIPDDLDDVIDDEEDDDWKNWGKKKSSPDQFDLNPSDLDNMEPSQIQAELMKRQSGPVYGFVKLRFGVQRTKDSVAETAMRWSQILQTGGLEVRFMGMDLSTIMFTSETAKYIDEVKEYILEQQDAYEVKIGDSIYRRPGDPPLEEVLQTLRKENEATDEHKERAKEDL